MRTLLLLSTLAFAACSNEAILNAAYPERARFQFLNSLEDTVFYWACENGPTAAETESRAKAAHQFMDGQINAIADENAARLIEATEAGQSALRASFDLVRRTDAQMEVVVAQTEERFQCLMYDNEEL